MKNDINYTATINVDWINFKEQKGVVIRHNEKNGVTTLQTFDEIPSNLKLLISENKGKTRTANIVFKQNEKVVKNIVITQNSNKEGIFTDGAPYLDKAKTGLLIQRTDGDNILPINGGNAFFTALYTEVYLINKYETDSDGIEIRRWAEVSSQNTTDVTNQSTWEIRPSDSNANISIDNDKAKLSVSKNNNNFNLVFSIQAKYKDLLSNVIRVNQNSNNVRLTYKVKTNNKDTIVHFLDYSREVKTTNVTNKDGAYYASYEADSNTKPLISAYITKDATFDTGKITLYKTGTEEVYPNDFTWNANPNGDTIDIDVVYSINKTTYKVDNDKNNPIYINDNATVEINSSVISTNVFKDNINDISNKSQWINVTQKSNNTINLSVDKTSETKDDGFVIFKYKKDGLPEASIKIKVIQKVN